MTTLLYHISKLEEKKVNGSITMTEEVMLDILIEKARELYN